MWNRSKVALLTLASIHLGVASVAMAQEKGSNSAAPQAPAGYVLVEEDHWHKLADEPALHIGRAREAFLMKDARTAASELHKAAIHVRIGAGHAAGLEKNALLSAAHDLEHTAQRLDDRKVTSVAEIDLAPHELCMPCRTINTSKRRTLGENVKPIWQVSTCGPPPTTLNTLLLEPTRR